RRITIGAWPEISVADARDAADGYNGDSSNWKRDGFKTEKDPFTRQKHTGVPLFSELVEAYVIGQVRVNANSPEYAERNLRWLIGHRFAKWLKMPIDQIGIKDVLAVKKVCGERQIQANRCIELVQRMFNWSCKSTDGKVNFWKVENPAKDVSKH